MIYNILSLSGGKDSTALALMIHEGILDINIHEMVFCNTGMEFPEMYRHLDKLEAYLDKPITRIKSELDWDHYMFDYIKKRGVSAGKKGYGWPYHKVNWCTKQLKNWPMDKYLKSKYDNYNEIVGITIDEPKRIKSKSNKIYPLLNNKMTGGMCLKFCYDRGFDWEGLYTKFNRVSCWCCHNSSNQELFMLFYFYPKLWQRLIDMDSRSWNNFKNNIKLIDLEKRFKEYAEKIKY